MIFSITEKGQAILSTDDRIKQLRAEDKIILIILRKQGPLGQEELSHEINLIWQTLPAPVPTEGQTRRALRRLFEAEFINSSGEGNDL
ncbi:hypothetical protein LCGC14_0840050 [marine sediment metagenome]|uniref:Uncharacterized protein n=1 Tax=marine sediment metagenome TaxID=412755 RepID=A0A0F9PYM9_9ZZZZ